MSHFLQRVRANPIYKCKPLQLGFAYAMYRPYWINDAFERIYLTDHPEKDIKHPMALREEEGKCQYALDLKGMKAISQTEIVYTNRSGQRIIYQNCHKTPSSKTVPITITQQGCKSLHDLKKGISYQQQRFIYTVNGVQHEALEAHPVEPGVKHQFDPSVCKPIVDEVTKHYQPMAKRVVSFVKEGVPNRIELSDCTKFGDQTPLSFDDAVCKMPPHNGFHHDMARGHSYSLGRWYYHRPQGKKYVTDCQTSDKAYQHQQRIVGYEHDDANKRSYPITSFAIEPVSGKFVEIKDRTTDRSKSQPYIKTGERLGKSTDKDWFDACYKTIKTEQKAIYERVDKSEFEEALPDKIQRSENLCTYSTTPVAYEHVGMSWGKGKEFIFYEGMSLAKMQGLANHGHWLPETGYMWEAEKILVDEYIQYPVSPFHPKGKKELKHHRIWQDEYQDKKPQNMVEWATGHTNALSPPYQTKKWKKGERKVDLRFK